jgi:hypothetical protein
MWTRCVGVERVSLDQTEVSVLEELDELAGVLMELSHVLATAS